MCRYKKIIPQLTQFYLQNKNATAPERLSDIQVDDGTADDIEAVMTKYDRKSNTRTWKGIPYIIVKVFMVVFAAYSILKTLLGTCLRETRLIRFLALILIIGYLNFPARTVAVACAMVGIVAGCITSIGLESKLITTIVSISSEHAAIALVLTIRCCIVLGMGCFDNSQLLYHGCYLCTVPDQSGNRH